MKIQDITSLLESFAPLSLQEDYDNSGFITGNPDWDCSGLIITLDITAETIKEAIEKKCNLIIAHHPIIFKGLKKITGKTYVERIVIEAIKNDISLYAIHTNLDNISKGVNSKIAEKLNLTQLQILQPKESLIKKLVTYAPLDKAEQVRQALFKAGAGNLGKYSECSFNIQGTGTFKPGEGADPFVGAIGERHEENEIRIEVIFPAYIQPALIEALIQAHPYEEAAYDIFSLGNYFSDLGSGLSGILQTSLTETELLSKLSSEFGLSVIKHSKLTNRKISKVAVCGGAGIFLLPAALSVKADAYITSDIKYHEYFDAEGRLLLADIGHYESEQFTIDLLYDQIRQKFPNFAVLKTGINTNPVQYFKNNS